MSIIPPSTMSLAEAIAAIAEQIRTEPEGTVVAQKLMDLAGKAGAERPLARVAFCGLFSAGKTSLLKVLCQRPDLATGAIPTTALVTEIPLADEPVICLDTPGVDSTDESHQAATEAALHMADAIVLVMDYQQVESDTNLDLAESFAAKGKTLFLVINQVDKHVAWELPFVDYQRRVERTFADWGIPYRRILYTSTKQADHPGLRELRQTLSSLAEEVDAEESLVIAARALVGEHVQRQFQSARAEADAACLSACGQAPYDEVEARAWLAARAAELDAQDALHQDEFAHMEQERRAWFDETVRAIDLAQISPYATTELGRHYVESLRPSFKVGWFRSEEKTQAERMRRLQQFVDDLGTHAQSFLLWPIQGMLRDTIASTSWADRAWLADVEGISATVTEERCAGWVKSGSLISEQYPYQYVKDVVQAVKGAMRGQVTVLLDKWFDAATERLTTAWAQRPERVRLRQEADALTQWLEVAAAAQRDVERRLQPLA